MIPYGTEGKKKNLAYVFLNHTISFIQRKKDLNNMVFPEGNKIVLLAALLSPLVWLQEGRQKAQMASNKIL